MLKFNRSNSVQWSVAPSLLVAAVWVFAAVLSAPTAFAVTRYVSLTGTDLNNSCSDKTKKCKTIGWAVQQAQSGDLVAIDPGTYYESQIIVSKNNLTIRGSGAGSLYPSTDGKVTVVWGNKQGPVFMIESGVTAATIKAMWIFNGMTGIWNLGDLTVEGVSLAANGGDGIYNEGKLTLLRVWLANNDDSGLSNNNYAVLKNVMIFLNRDYGVFSGGSLNVSNSAIISNSTGVNNLGELHMLNVTISKNILSGLRTSGHTFLSYVTVAYNAVTAGGNYSGIERSGTGEITTFASIVYGNYKPWSEQCLDHSTDVGGFTDMGYNVFNDSYGSCGGPSSGTTIDDPDLEKLWAYPYANSAAWFIHKLKQTSPAINRVPQSLCTPQDQLDLPRPIGAACDAGAYEYKP